MQLADFYNSVFSPWFLRSRSRRTKCLYETTIRNYALCLGRSAELDDLNDLAVNRFLGWLKSRELSPFTINKERSNLLAIWRFAARKKYLDHWPDVPTETEPTVIPQAWTVDEIQRIFAACDSQRGKFDGIPCPLWWRSLLSVIWDTGERIGAVRNLCWYSVDLRRAWLVVPAALRKGGKADKAFQLAPDTVELLRESRKASRNDLVFPWPYSDTYLWKRFGKLLKSAGIDNGARSKFHKIRRTVASYYEAAGGDATELLGHSDRKITRKHYLDPRIVPQQKPACDVLFRPLTPEK